MQHPFIEFLIERDFVSAEVARTLYEDKRHVREPIGTIAVSHGLLQTGQIDTILDHQVDSDKRFGQIAVELGFLTQQQVETLVKIQQSRVPTDIAEVLALAGVMSCEDAFRHVATYTLEDQEVEAIINDA
jgi:hypothetical protein